MTLTIGLLVLVIFFALAFDFTNGFHDAANAIASVVATKALSLRSALLLAAGFNILGALLATNVAVTIEKGIIDKLGTPTEAQLVLLAGLIGAIFWNVATWLLRMPTSSSHALVGGLVGAGFALGGNHDLLWTSINEKMLIPMFVSPLLALIVGGTMMLIVRGGLPILAERHRHPIFRKLQIATAALMAFSVGSNDGQKTMGVITMALVGAGLLPANSLVPWWVIMLAALVIGWGTYCGGNRIIETVGKKLTSLNQESGFSANLGASFAILLCTRWGLPVSTTYVVVGSITGSGLADRQKISGRTWIEIAFTWICTLPGTAVVAYLSYRGLAWLILR